MQAALLSVKLDFIEQFTDQRRAIAKRYDRELANIANLILPVENQGARHVYHIYLVRTKNRVGLMKHLVDNGVSPFIHYPLPPHLQEAYNELGYAKGDFPLAEEIAETCLSLPLYPGLTDEQIDHIIYSVKSFFETK
jgi:dTDP-4-amino-4,6-dideoxygalactose transaminase